MSNNILKWYSITHIFVLLLLLSFIFFATPAADDYIFVPANNTKGLIPSIIGFLAGWGGRYSVPFVNYIWYNTLNGMSLPYSIGLIIDLVIFVVGIWCAIKCAVSNKISIKTTLLITFLITVGIIRGLPTLDESIYWHSTGISYLTSLSAMFLTIYLLFILVYNKHKYLIIFACSLLMIYSSGMIENFIIANITIALCFITYMSTSSKCKLRYYILLFIALLCLLPAILTNGNQGRMGVYPNSGQFLYSLYYGALFGTRSLLQSIIDPYILGSILLLSPLMLKLFKLKNLNQIRLKTKLVYIFALLINLYAIPAIHYYGTGNRPVQRFMCVWYVLFFMGILSISLLFAPQLIKLTNTIETKFTKIVGKRISPKTFLLTLSLLSFLLINNPPKAIYDLIYNIPIYLDDVSTMHTDIKKQQLDINNDGILRIKQFQTDPILLKTPLAADYGISNYYGFKSLQIIKTKGE